MRRKGLPSARQPLSSSKMELPSGRQLVYPDKEPVRPTKEPQMTVGVNKVLAAVYAPDSPSALVAFTKGLLERTDGNSTFPAPVPSHAKVRKAVDALEEAEVTSQSRTRGTKQVRERARRDGLSRNLRREAAARPSHPNGQAREPGARARRMSGGRTAVTSSRPALAS